MAKKYKYSFTRDHEAKEGLEALVLSGISFAAFIVLAIISFAFSGKGGVVLGAIGLVAMLLAVYGCYLGLKGLAVLIMGGLGNVEGAMAGGFILGIAEVFSVAYGTSSYRDAVAFGLIILILFIRPEGLFAKAGKGGRP